MTFKITTKAIRAYREALLLDPCVYCGATAVVLDHLVAKSKGGRGTWDNLVPACWACNTAKRNRSMLGYLLYAMRKPEWDAIEERLTSERRILLGLGQ